MEAQDRAEDGDAARQHAPGPAAPAPFWAIQSAPQLIQFPAAVNVAEFQAQQSSSMSHGSRSEQQPRGAGFHHQQQQQGGGGEHPEEDEDDEDEEPVSDSSPEE
ncbi:hypothetical protein BS78_07G215900 [Paspalum vaginatum]|nr:hypothetical protein BS78_07G215900 [Paspalum vaginatum]